MESLTQECGFRIYSEIYSWELLSTLISVRSVQFARATRDDPDLSGTGKHPS